MKTCANREEWLGALLYRDLPFDEETQAEEHLEACAACRAERASLARLAGALPAAAPVPSPRSRSVWGVAAAALLGLVAGLAVPRHRDVAPPRHAPSRVTVTLLSPEAAAFVQRGSSALPAHHRATVAERLK